MKEIKELSEVLHMYLGCEVRIEFGENAWSNRTFGDYKIVGIDTHNEIKLNLNPTAGDSFPMWYKPDETFKLKVRRLSSMTEEEAKEIYFLMDEPTNTFHVPVTKIQRPHGNVIQVSFAGNVGAGYSSGQVDIYLNRLNSKSFVYLLSKGFWLFNDSAFDKGLIIDAEK